MSSHLQTEDSGHETSISKTIQEWQRECQIDDNRAELEATRAGLTVEQFQALRLGGRTPTRAELEKLACILLKPDQTIWTTEELCKIAGINGINEVDS